MGLYKLCEHKGRNRDRCEHPWWGSFRGVRVSLTKWANREIRSKAEAGAVLDEMRMALRARTFDARGLAAPKVGPMTFRQLAEIHREQHVIPKRLAMGKNYTWSVKPFVDRFGDRALVDIRTADVQDFIADLRKPRAVHRRGVRVLSPSAVNRIVDLLRHMLNWAVGREYITSTPSKRGSESLIKKFQEDNVRRRRIDEEEEGALLANAPTHIQALIVAAIDTGMRSGEMLALRFADIDLERGLITLRGETTKSRKTRLVPIATTRLRDVFAWLRRDVEGNAKPLETRVFSNELGEPYRLFHRMWQSIVLKAHGYTPTWNPRLNYQGLSDESQETFRRINLRWHDLRHEYASRLVEHGVPLAQVRDLLGHASITTTERYDNQTLANLQVAAAKLERGLGFGAAGTPQTTATDRSPGKITDRRTSPAATTQGSGRRQRTDFQDSFKIEAAEELAKSPGNASRQGFERGAASVKRAETRLNTGRPAKRRACEEVWLGVRDDFRHYLVHAA
jgi:integrase